MELINVKPAIAELTAFTTQFTQLHTDLGSFLNDPNTAPPMVREVIANLSTVESVAVASSTRKMSANNISGYLTDLANHLGATQREMSIRYKSKATHYVEAMKDNQDELLNHANMQAEYSSAITGRLQVT